MNATHRIIGAAVAVGLLLIPVAQGIASLQPVTNAFFYDGTVNLADDRNADYLIDKSGAGTVDVGDFLLAIIKIDTIESEGGGSQSINDTGTGFREMTAISLIKVAGVGPPVLGSALFTFTAPTIDEWVTETTALGFAVTPTSPGVLAIIYEDPADAHNFDRLSTVSSGLTTSFGTLMWEAGFTGTVTDVGGDGDPTNDTVAPGAFEGWTAFAPIAFPPTFGPPTLPSEVSFALNTITLGPAGVPLAPTTRFSGVVGFGGPTDFQGSGTFEPPASGSSWPLFSNTNTYILPVVVPEPSTVLVWSVLGVLSILASRRSRG